jgi:hypothetical protein
MLYKKLNEDELEFCECFYSPIALIECLIPENIKAPHIWSESDCSLLKLRPYQFAMVDYSFQYAYDDKLSAKENFRNKQGAGWLINVAARNLGKSLFAVIDAFLTVIHGEGDESCIASFDFAHLKKICTPVANLCNYHPFFQLFRKKGKECVRFTGGGMEIDTSLGHVMYGRNENINSPDPGTAFHSLHVKKNIYDEVSYMTEEGRKKMADAMSSEGCIERLAGIPDIRLGSPLGRILRDESKHNWICTSPQFIREDWDEKTKAEKMEEYGGETSLMYKLNVLGEPIEGANSRWDMDRLKKNCYNPKRHIKQFEVGKDTFYNFDKIIILDKQPGELSIIASDIGTTGSPSEVCVYFGDSKLLKWRYNISLFQLTTQEQAKVFKWLFEKVDNGIIALDCTSDGGRAIADELEILGTPKDKICRVMFNTKMIVGFDTDDNNLVKYDDKGNPIYKLERTIDFANLQLDNMFYHGLIEVPHSEKFLREFAGYFEVMTGTTKRYGSSTTDHLVQSFQVCAVARFQSEFANLSKPEHQNHFVAGF